MTPFEFLDHDSVKRPIEWGDTDDMLRRVKERLDEYVTVARKLDQTEIPTDKRVSIDHIDSICNKIWLALKSYLRGDLSSAYRSMDDLFRQTALSDLVTSMSQIGRPVSGGRAVSFRLRESQSPLLNSGELFHVPIQRRHLIESNRFSVPGLPTLYLGGSLLTCWHELGCPSFESTYAAAIWMERDQECRVFSLSATPQAINSYLPYAEEYQQEEQASELAGDLLFQWPLLMCCLIPVKHPNSPFKPEYLLPQGLMSFVTHNKDIDAVAFPSSKVSVQSYDQVGPSTNYAFPISGEVANGYDPKLKGLFRSTPPVQWTTLASLDYATAHDRARHNVEIAPGISVPHESTAFGKAEANLVSIAHKIQMGTISGSGRIVSAS